MAMGTLINGADAGVAIITSAVAAANATIVRAHQVVGQVDSLANDWAQSPLGAIIGASCTPAALPQMVQSQNNWLESQPVLVERHGSEVPSSAAPAEGVPLLPSMYFAQPAQEELAVPCMQLGLPTSKVPVSKVPL